ncbi:MAG: rRNA methyltransferase [Bacteroidetes bacterium GWF2_33_16]|nr:MAG: rRNA methyltransferase [Bacteroidetes bacterium GWE2_32_14]OFY05347.1 MAG: rRNA methyltransferase [Bacteroidetes bacterium GWF2_33_16]
MEKITSIQNPRIKNIVKLQQKSSERKNQNLIVIEGFREIALAIKSGIEIKAIFFCSEIISSERIKEINNNENLVFDISREVYHKIAYRESTEGILVLAEPCFLSLKDLKLRKNPFLIILESVEKPGNLGAILRTADAANVDAVIICDPLTDIYNPNVIRSAVGCVFTNKVVACSSEKAMHWLKENKIKSFAAALTAKQFYHETDFTGSSAIVMGTEADGLTQKWIKGTDEQIKIPMNGEIDSLNVSTSTAILVFEAMRQRNFYK